MEALRDGANIEAQKLFENLTREESFKLEIHWIKKIGRYEFGTVPLLNLHGGGSGCCDWSPSSKAKVSISKRVVQARPGVKAKMRASTRRLWADKKYVAKVMSARAHPNVRAKVSANIKARWNDPSYVDKVNIAKKIAMARPDVKKRIGAASKAVWDDPHSRAKIIAARALPDVKARQSAAIKAAFALPGVKEAQSAQTKLQFQSLWWRNGARARAEGRWPKRLDHAQGCPCHICVWRKAEMPLEQRGKAKAPAPQLVAEKTIEQRGIVQALQNASDDLDLRLADRVSATRIQNA